MHAFERKLAESWPPADWCELSVLVAVSGGADSVALLRALAGLRPASSGRLLVAHFNHLLRQEAAGDEQFVVDLSRRLGCACEVAREPVAELAALSRDGLETAARDRRHEFLRRTAQRLGARFVATAHTADDQAETILHRMLRGTGLGGLAGMPRVRPLGPAATLIRPMLSLRRAEVVGYLAELGQPYRDDATNLDTRFTRNRLRHDLLPRLVRDYNLQVVEALLRLGRLAGEAQETIASLVEPLMERSLRVGGQTAEESRPPGEVTIDCRRLAGQPRYVVRELLIAVWRGQGYPEQAMTLEHWERLAELAAGQGEAVNKWTYPGGILATRDRDLLTFSRSG